MDIEIPSNTTADIVIPVKGIRNAKLTESGTLVWQNGTFYEGVPGINNIENNIEMLTVKAGSGKYRFVITGD